MIRLAAAAMGTRFELALLKGAGDLRAAGEAAIEEIEQWHRRLSRFTPDSLVSHINRTAALQAVQLDRETFSLFEDALRVCRESEGAFDVSNGGGGIVLDPLALTIRLTDSDVSVDLGGIAKGHALDCAAALLNEHGVSSALLHGGTSSVVAIGQPPDSDGWAIALGPGRDDPALTLYGGQALSVSDANSQRADTGVVHIVDRRTGTPVERSRRVAVVGPSARLADAWSTALVVLDRVPSTFPAEYEARFFPGDAAT